MFIASAEKKGGVVSSGSWVIVTSGNEEVGKEPAEEDGAKPAEGDEIENCNEQRPPVRKPAWAEPGEELIATSTTPDSIERKPTVEMLVEDVESAPQSILPGSEPLAEAGSILPGSEPLAEAGSIPPGGEPLVEAGSILPGGEPLAEAGSIPPGGEPLAEAGSILPGSEPLAEAGSIPPGGEPLAEAGSILPGGEMPSKVTTEDETFSGCEVPQVHDLSCSYYFLCLIELYPCSLTAHRHWIWLPTTITLKMICRYLCLLCIALYSSPTIGCPHRIYLHP